MDGRQFPDGRAASENAVQILGFMSKPSCQASDLPIQTIDSSQIVRTGIASHPMSELTGRNFFASL
jgi:hypothetical protein